MNLKDLAKCIQDYVRDGICNIVIYKDGRQWHYYDVWSWDDDKDREQEEKVNKAKEIDPNAIVLNGYYDFGNSSLAYIYWHIQRIYYKSKYENSVCEDNESPQELHDDNLQSDKWNYGAIGVGVLPVSKIRKLKKKKAVIWRNIGGLLEIWNYTKRKWINVGKFLNLPPGQKGSLTLENLMELSGF